MCKLFYFLLLCLVLNFLFISQSTLFTFCSKIGHSSHFGIFSRISSKNSNLALFHELPAIDFIATNLFTQICIYLNIPFEQL